MNVDGKHLSVYIWCRQGKAGMACGHFKLRARVGCQYAVKPNGQLLRESAQQGNWVGGMSLMYSSYCNSLIHAFHLLYSFWGMGTK